MERREGKFFQRGTILSSSTFKQKKKKKTGQKKIYFKKIRREGENECRERTSGTLKVDKSF